MTEGEIKFRVIQLMQGIKYLSKDQIQDFKAYVYHKLKIEKSETNDKIIEDAFQIYFNM